MTPKQVLSHMTQEQIEELTCECCEFLEVQAIASALIRGLTGGELERLFQALSHHIGPNEFDLSD